MSPSLAPGTPLSPALNPTSPSLAPLSPALGPGGLPLVDLFVPVEDSQNADADVVPDDHPLVEVDMDDDADSRHRGISDQDMEIDEEDDGKDVIDDSTMKEKPKVHIMLHLLYVILMTSLFFSLV